MGDTVPQQSRLKASRTRIPATRGAEPGALRDADALAALLAALDPDDLADALDRLPADTLRRLADRLNTPANARRRRP